MTHFDIAICNQQQVAEIDENDLRRTVHHVLDDLDVTDASVSIAVVDDQTIRRLKDQYFDRNQITDVISFNLADEPDRVTAPLDCEVVINAQRAAQLAAPPRSTQAELNLYLIHGLLHQLGYDDRIPQKAADMHEKEDQLLTELGFGKVYSS